MNKAEMLETMKTLNIQMQKEQEKAIGYQKRIIEILTNEKANPDQIQWEIQELKRLEDWMATSKQAYELKLKKAEEASKLQ